MKRTAVAAVFILVASTIAGCGTQPPLPQDHFYRLQVAAPQKVFPRPPLNGTVEIDRFSADAVTGGRALVFRRSDQPYELQQYNYHYWTEPPGLMLRDQLVFFLRAAKAAPTIVTPDVRANADYFINGKILRFERVLGGTPRAAFKVQLSVREAGSGRILKLATYELEAPAVSERIGDTVLAFDGIVTKVYERFLADISNL